jgi:hypothetical protein
MDDDVSIQEPQRAVEHLHGADALRRSRRGGEVERWTSGSTARSSGKAP